MRSSVTRLPADIVDWLAGPCGFTDRFGSPEAWPNDEILLQVAPRFGFPVVPFHVGNVDLEAFEHHHEQCALQRFLPTFSHRILLCIVSPEPFDLGSIREIRRTAHKEVRIVGCLERDFDQAFSQTERLLQQRRRKRDHDFPVAAFAVPQSWDFTIGNAERVLQSIIEAAFHTGASDVQIEPTDSQIDIRFFYGSGWESMPPIEKEHGAALAHAFKLRAGLSDVTVEPFKSGKAEFEFKVGARTQHIDLRVEVAPSIYGDTVSGRLQPRDPFGGLAPTLPFSPADNAAMLDCITRDQGLILVVGPTGCGKTTLLCKCLGNINATDRNIRTLEDPPEIAMPGVVQFEVGEKVNRTYQQGLKSLLRQKPDVIMIGEIRSADVASTVVEAGLQGHLIFSTLHTQDSCGAIPRLLEMGVLPNLLQSVLCLVVAQRLVPVLCPNCRRLEPASDSCRAHFAMYGLPAPEQVAKKVGCHRCASLGTVGKRPIYEFFYPDSRLRGLMRHDVPEATLRAAWLKAGGVSMIRRGLELVSQQVIAWESVKCYEREPIIAGPSSIEPGQPSPT